MKKGGGRAPKEKPSACGWPPPVLVNGMVARLVLSVGLLDLSKLTGGQPHKLPILLTHCFMLWDSFGTAFFSPTLSI